METLLKPNRRSDDPNVHKKKVLRQQVLNFKAADLVLKPKYEEKLKFLSSTEFIRAFNDDLNYTRIGYTEVMNISSDFRKLNNLWGECFFSYRQRIDLLNILSDLKSLRPHSR